MNCFDDEDDDAFVCLRIYEFWAETKGRKFNEHTIRYGYYLHQYLNTVSDSVSETN